MKCKIYCTLRNVDNFVAKEFEFNSLKELKGYMDCGLYLIQDCHINGVFWSENDLRKLMRTFNVVCMHFIIS